LERSDIKVYILTNSHLIAPSPNLTVDKGDNARMSSFVGAIAIADLVKTTLGPKGMDKILQRVSQQDQSISVTNDGATILKSVNIDNPAAKVLVDIAKVQVRWREERGMENSERNITNISTT